ncbi:response regulator [bacterium]|nr:response regulator [bacterium]
MKIKILLVDDEKEYIESLSERLKLRDFDVDISFNGQSALDRIRHCEYDIVVLDMLMPTMDGMMTYERMKAINPKIHVIFVTGHAQIETAIQGMASGVYDYLIKPIDLGELIEKIKMAHEHKLVLEEQKRHREKKSEETEIKEKS